MELQPCSASRIPWILSRAGSRWEFPMAPGTGRSQRELSDLIPKSKDLGAPEGLSLLPHSAGMLRNGFRNLSIFFKYWELLLTTIQEWEYSHFNQAGKS